jgi:hypothetical protein
MHVQYEGLSLLLKNTRSRVHSSKERETMLDDVNLTDTDAHKCWLDSPMHQCCCDCYFQRPLNYHCAHDPKPPGHDPQAKGCICMVQRGWVCTVFDNEEGAGRISECHEHSPGCESYWSKKAAADPKPMCVEAIARTWKWTHIIDTAFYDKPLSSIFQYVENGAVRYFYHHWWNCTENRKKNQWLVVPVSAKQIFQYVADMVSIRDLVNNPEGGNVYLMWIDEEAGVEIAPPFPPSDLDQANMPDEDCFCGMRRDYESQ